MPFHEKSGASGQDWAFNAALSSLKKKKKIEIFQTNVPSLASSQER